MYFTLKSGCQKDFKKEKKKEKKEYWNQFVKNVWENVQVKQYKLQILWFILFI